jgi:two-component system alkaline phosphatase synthesis response regulator PhoP
VAAAPKTVLVVDDEPDIVDLLRYNLTREGYRVETASNGEEALRSVAAKAPDLIVLDLMMPVLDGFETVRRLKADTRSAGIPVIFLTARSAEVDEVVGLELGADDYIQKPISPRKLVARVKAVFRRREGMQEPGAPEVIRAEHIEINRTTYTVRLAGTEAFFPRKEFELLSLLAGHPGKVFSREMLLNAIWGSDVVVVDRTVDVHIRKIREKLGDAAGMIETVKGVGYRFRE